MKIVCGADKTWPPDIVGSGCSVFKDLMCCAACPDTFTCPHNCGIHGQKYGTNDPRIWCEFIALMREEDWNETYGKSVATKCK